MFGKNDTVLKVSSLRIDAVEFTPNFVKEKINLLKGFFCVFLTTWNCLSVSRSCIDRLDHLIKLGLISREPITIRKLFDFFD